MNDVAVKDLSETPCDITCTALQAQESSLICSQSQPLSWLYTPYAEDLTQEQCLLSYQNHAHGCIGLYDICLLALGGNIPYVYAITVFINGEGPQ